MATRSIVAARNSEGTRGVYVHFDGHPEIRLPILRALIRRDGVERVVDTIIGKPNGWLTLDENQADESLDDNDVVVVAGYGEQCIGEIANCDYWAPGGDIPDEIEYIYVLGEDGSIDWAYAAFVQAFDVLAWHTEHPRSILRTCRKATR